MKALSSKQVLQEHQTTDVNAITSLTFTHRALSDVSCLVEFKNLERLDLTFNNLYSLEGLKPCLNLKWLSVKQNKLRSLKGIEGLINLTVLNAGNNMLQSMEEVRDLVRLRALILNDNQIVSICRLDQMKELNTLVLSRNPVCKIGEGLSKVKSITKLSLSYCKIQAIDSSIKSCTELRELRLAHNEIRTLPSELSRNIKIHNLDLGNNLIMKWSDLKVLSSLVNLKNLNLVGNPIAEKDVLVKKIKKLVPSLQIFNGRPIDKTMKNAMGATVDDISVNTGDDVKKEQKVKKEKKNKPPKENASDDEENDWETTKERKRKKKMLIGRENENSVIDKEEIPSTEPNLGKKSKHKLGEMKQHPEERANDTSTSIDRKPITKSKKTKQDAIDVEAPTVNLFTADAPQNDGNRSEKRDANTVDGLVSFPKKNKRLKSKDRGSSALQLLSTEAEVGLGGPSAWDVE